MTYCQKPAGIRTKWLALGLALAFGFVAAGTVSAQTEAEQLAAQLNALKKGSAKADGATVTLSGGVDIKTGLTVPAGVTLDLSAKNAGLVLKNGAILTVDGVVDAKNEGIKVDSAAAKAALINGSGTINLKSKGFLLNVGKGKGLILDGGTLVGLKDNSRALVAVGEDGDLLLKNGAITGNISSSDEGWIGGGGVYVERGRFTMEGGEISGNSVQNSGGYAGGGGVNVESGILTVKGGKISGNSANGKEKGQGGGVNFNNGTFTMTGGEISGNTADWAAGVCIDNVENFTKSGGTIYGDTDSIHTAGSAENTAKQGTAHAVGLGKEGGKVRSRTAGPEVKLYAKTVSGGYDYQDTSAGGVGNTTANWVENGR